MSYSLEYGEYRERPLAYLRESRPDYNDAAFLARTLPKFFELPNYFAEGYEGGTVERSNHRVWAEEFDALEGKNWWDLHNSGILVRLDLLTTAQLETLNALEGYPLISDDDHSQLEHDLQAENWQDYGRSDFRRFLVSYAEKHNPDYELLEDTLETLVDDAPESAIDRLYWQLCENASRYPEQDSGTDGTSFPDEELFFYYSHRVNNKVRVWTGDITWLETELYGAIVVDSDNTPMWLANAETLETMRVLRESDYLDGNVDGALRPDVACLIPRDDGEPKALYIEQRETLLFDGE